MKKAWLLPLLLAAAILCLLSLSNGIGHPASTDRIRCLPSFPDRDGWYGGDGAYSLLLDSGRTLWLFGDSFVSETADRPSRVNMHLVMGNTLAISTCSQEGQFQIRYVLKKREGQFVPFFGDQEWMWPQDPFLVRNRLYVPLLVVAPDPQREGPFKFRIIGHKVALIRNHDEPDPLKWAVEYLDWSAAVPTGVAALATTSVVHGHHVYFYPLCTPSPAASGVLGNILVRVPTDRLHDPVGGIEYFTKEGSWQKGLDPANAKIVLDAAVSELSVRYHESRQQWIAVYLSLRHQGDQLLYRWATTLEGPWSAPKVLIPVLPERDPGNPEYDPRTFCYAGKEHLQFATEETLVTTYVCNSLAEIDQRISPVRERLFLYRPVVREVPY